MEDIFFDTGFISWVQLLLRIAVFLSVTGLLLYVIYFVLTKVLFRKSVQRREVSLRLTFLWTLFAYLILFNAYIVFLFYRNGLDSLRWTVLEFYLGFSAQLSIYLGLLIIFFIKRKILNKIINDKSIS